MNFDEALRYMEGLLRFGWKLGNERFEVLCEQLGNPQTRNNVIHVAGTKGKGSTTAMAAAILRAEGFNVGAYFSPYVFDVRERVQVNGSQISKDDFARLVTLVKPHVDALADTDYGPTTEFELKTIVALLYFAERDVDFACLEVGLGGRLDATNVASPLATVITNIGLDHTTILGDTLAKIAFEKAGIIKPGTPCFTATDSPQALEVIKNVADERHAPLSLVVQDAVDGPTRDPREVRWSSTRNPDRPNAGLHTGPVDIATENGLYADMPVAMAGLYQRANAACAVAAAERAVGRLGMKLSERAVRSALSTTSLPGRLSMTQLADGPLLILDGAHNGMAARALIGPLGEIRKRRGIDRAWLVIGMLEGHDPNEVVAALAPGMEMIFACAPDWRRALPAEQVAEAASRYNRNVVIVPSVPDAIRTAMAAAGSSDMVLVTGSFYTIGETPPEMRPEEP